MNNLIYIFLVIGAIAGVIGFIISIITLIKMEKNIKMIWK